MKCKYSVCICFLLVVYVWMGATFITAGMKARDIILRPKWNAAQEYPFLEQETNEIHSAGILDKVTRIQQKIDNMLKTSNVCYYDILILKRMLDRYVFGFDLNTSVNGAHIDGTVGDIIVEHTNGEQGYFIDNVDISSSIKKISDLSREMKENKRNFLYFESPYKSGELAEPYKNLYQDYSKEKIDEIPSRLRADGVEVLSMTEEIQNARLDRDELFFQTDHHWLPQTALWGCAVLGNWLNLHYHYTADLSLFNADKYSIQNGPLMLGSSGRRVTEVYGETEVLPLIWPKYDSDMEVFCSTTACVKRGTIKETLFDWEKYVPGDLYRTDKYLFYGCGDQALIQIHNNRKKDGKKLLIIKESFADSMVPYLSNVAEYVDVIDPRYFDGSIRTYINKCNPDTVVLVCGVAGFVSELDLD